MLVEAVLLTLVVTSTSCRDPGLSVEEARSRGFLRAGYSEEPPYAFVDSLGRVTGESPEALRAAAAAIDIGDVRWVRLDFGDLIPALEWGRIDVVAAGMFSTPQRERQVRFSRPTACSGPALVVRAGDHRFGDILELRDSASARVAVLPGSVEDAALRQLGVPADRMILTPDVRTALAAVEEGGVDAVAITAVTARQLTGRAESELAFVAYRPPASVAQLLRACSALAFRPGDESLAASLDSALVAVLRSPERRRLIRGYGFTGDTAAEGRSQGGDP